MDDVRFDRFARRFALGLAALRGGEEDETDPDAGRALRRRDVLRLVGVGAWAASGGLARPSGATARVAPCGPKRCGNGARCRQDARGRKRCECVNTWTTACVYGALVECHDLESGPWHCGGCDKPPCPSDQVCAGGECIGGDYEGCEASPGRPCADELPSKICCHEQGCVDPSYDANNCGLCGRRCTNRDPATGGVLKRPACCGGTCVDLHGHPRHCGGCEGDEKPNGDIRKPCAGNQLCYQGKCVDACPTGLRKCGRTCYHGRTEKCCPGRGIVLKDDMPSDPRNCGDCGRDCGDYDCCAGVCCDYNAPACCDGQCTNTILNNDHCGGCGNACTPPMWCRFGECVCPPGEDC